MNEEEEKIIENYEPNYLLKFITGSLLELQLGNVCYVYTKETLEELCKKLDEKRIKYRIDEEDDYWCITAKKGRGNGTKNQKN